jgi:sugar transferase (PEP-CTERM system associated)
MANFVCIAVESVGIFLSVFLAYVLLSSKYEHSMISLMDIVYRGIAITVFAQFCLYMLDLYDLNIPFTTPELFFSVTFTTGLFYLAIGIFILTIRDFYIERNIFYLAGVLLFFFLIAWRLSFHSYLNNHTPSINVLVFGAGEKARDIEQLVDGSRRLGFNLVGTVGKDTMHGPGNPGHAGNPPANHLLDDLKVAIERGNVHKIIVAQEDKRGHLPIRELLDYKINGIDVIEWPEFVENLAGKIPVKSLPPSFFVFNGGFNVKYVSKKLSEIFSLAFSFFSIVLMTPLFLVVSILIKWDSRGPVLYLQKRVGEKGKIFHLIKFRTMIENAEGDGGAVWASDGDPRITRIGRYLRQFRIDELPQFLNVLKGDMNLVGPRPERPEFVRILEEEIPYYSIRHSIKPGITGWAQVKGSYSGTIDESREKLEYDLFYLKNKSFKFDMLIIFKTIKTLMLARGAR